MKGFVNNLNTSFCVLVHRMFKRGFNRMESCMNIILGGFISAYLYLEAVGEMCFILVVCIQSFL